MKSRPFLLVSSLFLFFFAKSQSRLELIETNVPKEKIQPFIDSYMWTKNWSLVNGVIPDASKGANSLSANSKLTKFKIDSLSKEFKKYISVEAMTSDRLTPRINLTAYNKSKSYFRSSIYEINLNNIKLVCQFTIEFDSTTHNNLPDVLNIYVFNPTQIKPLSDSIVTATLNRKVSREEDSMLGPPVNNELEPLKHN